MRRLAAVLLLAAAFGAPACSAGAEASAPQLRVAAAASLQGAFEEIATAFRAAHPEIELAPITYDGSSTLATQIAEGAPVDVAAFADEATMARIADQTEAPEIFATNSLVIAVPEGEGVVETLEDLTDPGLDVVLCAPEVPCGAAARTALDGAGLVVDAASLEQNVTAVATKVAEGAADAGLVYRTDAAAIAGLDAVSDARLDAVVNSYPLAVTRATDAPDAAAAFVDFVTSDEGRAILTEAGFGVPQ
ncbi:molybdate ABC transporter substrate-binding protein [Microbacterium excoecariae]|uniref:molybdate ABC transporter substrate-binding protein n=1 Tax=Microbacterium excoecariae TaxID=2715210 RepID=UPI00140AA0F5|nr:molybdate ABC transporter substrate-binding protein [Microbacterium excoecariae]